MGQVCYGLSPKETLALTPAQFAAMERAHFKEKLLLDAQFAWVRQLIVEVNRDAKTRPSPFPVADFALFEDNRERVSQAGEMSWEQQLEFVKDVLTPHFNQRAEDMKEQDERRYG